MPESVGYAEAAVVERPAPVVLVRLQELVSSGARAHLIVHMSRPPSAAVLSAQAAGREADAFDALADAGFDPMIMRTTGSVINHVYQTVPGFAVEVPRTEVERFRELPGVRDVELDREFQISMDLGAAAVGAPVAWPTCDGTGVLAAVLDTGIDFGHPDFQSRVDLANSRNFVQGEPVSDVMDRHGHGTHVAAILAGSGAASNGLYRGIAPGATLLALKVFDAHGHGLGAWIAAAVEWAIKSRVDVINFSGGKRVDTATPWVWPAQHDFVESYFDAAATLGIPCAVAAGNDGALEPSDSTVTMPGVAEHVITVGSLRRAVHPAQPSSFSGRGQARRSDVVPRGEVRSQSALPPAARFIEVAKPDVVAPGGEVNEGGCRFTEGVVSARPTHASVNASVAACTLPTNQQYARLSGTSMATPVVAGICALITKRLQADGISLGRQKAIVLKNLIKRHAVDLGLAREVQGSGLVSWPAISAVLDEFKQKPGLIPQYEIPDL